MNFVGTGGYQPVDYVQELRHVHNWVADLCVEFKIAPGARSTSERMTGIHSHLKDLIDQRDRAVENSKYERFRTAEVYARLMSVEPVVEDGIIVRIDDRLYEILDTVFSDDETRVTLQLRLVPDDRPSLGNSISASHLIPEGLIDRLREERDEAVQVSAAYRTKMTSLAAALQNIQEVVDSIPDGVHAARLHRAVNRVFKVVTDGRPWSYVESEPDD